MSNSNKTKLIRERFLNKVKKTNSCWLWVGAKDGYGYGIFWTGTNCTHAQRFSYENFIGKIPKGNGYHGICVCHKCDNPSCVNPSHLWLGTHKDNMLDKIKKGRMVDNRGEKHGNSKLKAKTVIEIKDLYVNKNLSQSTIAVRFSVNQSTISRIINGLSWNSKKIYAV